MGWIWIGIILWLASTVFALLIGFYLGMKYSAEYVAERLNAAETWNGWTDA